jgi:uncharacterized protein YqhQ
VFQYHAAEHKAINAYEAGEELEPETVQRFSLIHPRCGTAFLLWVMVIAIFVFAFFGRPPGLWLQRLTTRQPSLDQIEVSIRALQEVLALEGTHDPNERKVEVMA